jgi:hypothetical protein
MRAFLKRVLIVCILASSLVLQLNEAFAASKRKVASTSTQETAEPEDTPDRSYVSGMAGVSDITNTGASAFTFSARIGTALYADSGSLFSIGFFANDYSKSVSSSGVSATGNVMILAGELFGRRLFHSGLYFGGRFGLGLPSLSFGSGAISISATGTSFAIGPFAGYEVNVSRNVALVVDADFMTLTSTSLNFTGIGSVPVATDAVLQFQAGIVFTF